MDKFCKDCKHYLLPAYDLVQGRRQLSSDSHEYGSCNRPQPTVFNLVTGGLQKNYPFNARYERYSYPPYEARCGEGAKFWEPKNG
jgi:hypothetical protein